MGKDAGGHGSEKRAVGYVKMPGSSRTEVHIGPSKAAVAKGRGWDNAVSFKAPNRVAVVHENMAKAKSSLEKRPGFVGWKK